MDIRKFGLERTGSVSVRPGDTFGKLTVIATGQIPTTYRYMAVCRCECGSPAKVVRFDHLKSGAVVSCGCVQIERSTTHGQTDSVHYDRWYHMITRCYDEQCPAWKDYGGRGIKVAERWHDLAVFVAELPAGYREGLEIDRIKNDGDYEPGNIQWSTRLENAQNRRSRRPLTLDGDTRSLTEWAEELGTTASNVHFRLNNGWSMDRALTEPIADRHENMLRAQKLRWAGHEKKPRPEPRVLKRFPYKGEDLTIAELAERTGIDDRLLRKRLCERGWSVEKATTP